LTINSVSDIIYLISEGEIHKTFLDYEVLKLKINIFEKRG